MSGETALLQPGVKEVNHLDVTIVHSGQEVGNVDRRFGDPEEVRANRAKLLTTLNPAKYVIQMPQLSTEFLDLSEIVDDDLEEEYPTDGLFIDRYDVALGLNPADCIAMALYSSGQDPVLGVIHVGRQGIDGGIHEAAVRHMGSRHDVATENIRAYFSPCIGPESYHYPQISAEQLADPKWKTFIDKRDGNYHIDLASRVVKDLAEVGIDPINIHVAGVDVGAVGSGYFSHARGTRMEEPEARNGFAAMLRSS